MARYSCAGRPFAAPRLAEFGNCPGDDGAVALRVLLGNNKAQR